MFDWLTTIGQDQAIYLVGMAIGVVLLAVIARRSRDLTTATLTLMAVAIAINVAVGSIAVALRLPIYLDSIGTVLVGVLAGPWAGAITGILSNVIWSILPIPGGGGPNAAFFAPVAGVIGLMAGFWGGRGVFQLRPDDARVGGFLALATGLAGAVVAYLVLQATIGVSFSFEDLESQNRFVVLGVVIALIGIAVGWISGRTIYRLEGKPERARSYLVWAATIGAAALIIGLVRLVFAPGGYLASMDGLNADGTPDGFPNLTSLALADPLGLIVAILVGVGIGLLIYRWASRGDNARLFPVWVGGLTTGLVAAAISAPIAAGVFGGVTGAGTDALVALFRTLGLNVLQSAFAQGLTSDPLDKTISYTIVFFILGALPITMRTMYTRGETTVVE